MKIGEIKGEQIKRFGSYRMIEHQLFALIFIVLVLTGLSQRFYNASWAEWFVLHMGGIDTIRLIHRSTGLIFAALILQHMVMAIYGVLFKHWAPTMIINKNDFTDAIHNIKYYFGISKHPARCNFYDYKQKFEYWGVMLGGIIMLMTGLILWFPTLVFKLVPFLPGEIIPAARVAHSNESMLAFLVIVIWHIYNAVFSPEVFPLDTTIFTGKISKERMIHEHPLAYEKLTGIRLEEVASDNNSDDPPQDYHI